MFYSSRYLLYTTTLLSFLSLAGGLIESQVVLAQRPVEKISSREEALLNEAKQLVQQVVELYRQGKYAEAVPLAEEALKIRQLVLGEQHPNVASSLNDLGLLYLSMGRYEDALPLFQQALQMRQSLLGKQHRQVAISLNNLALLYREMGRYEEALPLFQDALQMNQTLLGEHPNVAQNLNNLAALYRSMGRYEDALPLFQQALQMRQSLLGEQHPQVANTLNHLALLYESMGRYEDALPLFQDTLQMRQSLLGEQHPQVAISLNNLALLYSSMGRYEDALPLHQDALQMFQSLLGEQHPHVAISLNNLAGLYSSMGRYEDALPLHQDALQMSQSLLGEQHPQVASSLNHLAVLYSEMGRYEDALPLSQDALLMRQSLLGEQHPSIASSLNTLAFLYTAMGRYEDALPLFQDALQMSQSLLGEQHPGVAFSLNHLASLHQAQGQIDLALQFLQQGLEIEELHLERILSTGSEGQKEQYMQTISWAKDRSISLHLQSDPDNEPATHLALTTILRRKGRLLDFLSQSQQLLRQSFDPQSQQLLSELNQTRTAIANLYNQATQLPTKEYKNQLRVLSQQEQELVAQMSRQSRQLAQALEPVTVEQVQNRLPEESALVEFFQYQPYDPQEQSLGKPRYAVYVLPAQGQPQGIDLGEVEDFKPLLERFHLSVQTRHLTTEELKQVAQDLDEKLMAKVRPLLGNARHLFIAPDQELNVIPFEALVDETNSYLIETYQLTYLTSGRDLLRFSSEPTATLSPPMLFGAPDFHNSGQTQALTGNEEIVALHRGRQVNASELNFPALPGTLKEVQEIAQMLAVEPVLGAEAHEAALKEVNRPSILHIATHGIFLEGLAERSETNTPILDREIESLLRSGLALAGVQDDTTPTELEDGLFTALEATSLNLPKNWV
ncbi:MAG: tetratricopeptide repeat protein [Roseofilum sp. SID2]|uniref:CHAT domain-containing tetratricopeptide repeat protein n=1 Tax=Roseofilum sp. SID2 TaxID=2821498 RepID=UPI001B0BE51E|nr:tetratricopeptide repeat protein [Roseofilum sp. SID2]MBP0022607.1 tetratricopeptide repeat protein [Roseofilum sp. SID2]